jgi:hypothetical protein
MTGEPGDVRTAAIVLATLALCFVFLALWAGYDLPNVVNCTDTDALIVTVDVSAARKGALIKHEALGCDFYWYTAGARGD